MPPQAVLETLAALWAVLDELESKVAIAGGLALSFWGHPRSTRDVDLTLMTDTLKKLEAQLTRSGFVAQAPSRPLGPFDFVQYKFEPFESFVEVEVDILAGKDEYFRQAVRRAVAANIEGLSSPIRVLTREDLIIYKLLANRLIDQADILSLMEMHWDELDRDYLKLWTNQFDLSTEYDTAVQRYRELNP
jgi:hypothetical protein